MGDPFRDQNQALFEQSNKSPGHPEQAYIPYGTHLHDIAEESTSEVTSSVQRDIPTRAASRLYKHRLRDAGYAGASASAAIAAGNPTNETVTAVGANGAHDRSKGQRRECQQTAPLQFYPPLELPTPKTPQEGSPAAHFDSIEDKDSRISKAERFVFG